MRFLAILSILATFVFGEGVYATFDVVGEKESSLALAYSGIVGKINVEVGDRVKKGEILLELKNQSERSDLLLAKNSLKAAELSYKKANDTYERYLKAKEVIEEERLEQIKLERDIKAIELEKGENLVAQKQAILDKTILAAPYEGIIAAKYVELGEGINGGGDTLFDIFSKERVKLVLSFDEKYWNSVKKGDRFLYRVDGDLTQREGVIAKVYPSVNPKNRKMSAEVYAEGILPGLFGEGSIEGAK